MAIRAKYLHRDLIKELQFEDPSDYFVRQILVQKDTEEYEPPAQYLEIKELLQAAGSDPWKQNKALSLYRFNKIQEMGRKEPFSIERILAYLAQLMIIEYWNELDQAKGQMILDAFKEN